MTPWAELLVNPAMVTDEVVRKAFQALSRTEHPDLRRDRQPGPRWFAITAAYSAVKTTGLRATWHRQQAALAGLCGGCGGVGVTVKLLGKDKGVRPCATCAGEGRLAKSHGRKK